MIFRVYDSLRILALFLALILSACSPGTRILELETLRVLPHDPSASTQGLLLSEGVLYESTGGYGESRLRQVRLEDGRSLREVPLAADEFGEGLALVDDRLIQLTWREGVAHVYDKRSLRPIGAYRYQGEGWGLCDDGEMLWMSDGSAVLQRRNRENFRRIGHLEVRLKGRPQARLNELECVGPHLFANVFHRDQIVRIDKQTGQIDAIIDASALVRQEKRINAESGVLNGIAWIPGTERFLLTGKRWSSLFEVRFLDPHGDARGH